MNGGEHPSTQLLLQPSATPVCVCDHVVVQRPLSRRGRGPGLVLLVPRGIDLGGSVDTLDPPPLQKWAEEGFAVAQIDLGEDDGTGGGTVLRDLLGAGLDALAELEECDSVERVGVISYNVALDSDAATAIDDAKRVVALVTYGGERTTSTSKPHLLHSTAPAADAATAPAKSSAAASSNTRITHNYHPQNGPFFPIPSHHDFRSAAAAIAHTRTLAFLKPLTGGPYFDLEAVWEEHTRLEFGERDVGATMATMVAEPYVNHIPTLTGGIGRERLTAFYTRHFVFSNPADTRLELVSRTVGVDRVIDEFVFAFTHDREIDWLIPGIPPTFKQVEVPFTSVVNVRGDRLYHEHISWDQATLLRQLGLMPEYLPFPYALPDGSRPGPGRRYEYRVPTAGRETASKLRDESAVGSNGLFGFEVREVLDR